MPVLTYTADVDAIEAGDVLVSCGPRSKARYLVIAARKVRVKRPLEAGLVKWRLVCERHDSIEPTDGAFLPLYWHPRGTR